MSAKGESWMVGDGVLVPWYLWHELSGGALTTEELCLLGLVKAWEIPGKGYPQDINRLSDTLCMRIEKVSKLITRMIQSGNLKEIVKDFDGVDVWCLVVEETMKKHKEVKS